MAYPIEFKNKAIQLRSLGYSLSEISQYFKISKNTASLWLNHITLNKKAQERLKKRHILGQYKSMKIAQTKRKKIVDLTQNKTISSLKQIPQTKSLYKLLVSFLFWTEGGKSTDSYVYFINSDPKMVKLFVYLLRQSFKLNELKFRAMIHIHEYHNVSKQLKYWSKITNIPTKQFSKSYLKPNTGKRIRDGYQGSVRIRYYDYKIALELRSFYNSYVSYLGL